MAAGDFKNYFASRGEISVPAGADTFLVRQDSDGTIVELSQSDLESALSSKFAALAPVPYGTSPQVAQATRLANLNARYLLNVYLPTQFPGTGAISSWGGGTSEHYMRPPSQAARALATLLHLGLYDSQITGVSESDARAQCVRLVTSLAHTHRATSGSGWGGAATTPGGGANAGFGWQAHLWATFAGMSAHMLWDDLSSGEQGEVEAMVRWEARRQTATPIWRNYWRDRDGAEIYAGDSKWEEMGWHSAPLVLALTMWPDDPAAPAWRRKIAEVAVAMSATPDDFASTDAVNGIDPEEFLLGSNVATNGEVTNHGRTPHPDYSGAWGTFLLSAVSWAFHNDVSLPTAINRNIPLVYGALSTVDYATPTYNAPGGPIYKLGAERWYAPKGNDWGPERPYWLASFDAAAARFGWDATSTLPASEWLLLHLRHLHRLMSRFDTGQTYLSGEDGEAENNYGSTSNLASDWSRESDVGASLSAILLALTSDDPQWDMSDLDSPATAVSWWACYWANAGESANPDDGTAASAATDVSGNSRDVAQATSGSRPVFRDGDQYLGYMPGWDFDGTDDRLELDSLSLTQPYSVAAVVTFDTISAQAVVGIRDNVTSRCGVSSAGKWVASAGAGTNLVSADGPTINTPYFVVFELNDTSSRIIVNGVEVADGAAGTGALAAVVLGSSEGSGSYDLPLNGKIGFAAVYDGLLSAAAGYDDLKEQIVAYYGLTLGDD